MLNDGERHVSTTADRDDNDKFHTEKEPTTKFEDAGDKELLEVLQSDCGDQFLRDAAMNDESDETELLQVLESKKDNETAPILVQEKGIKSPTDFVENNESSNEGGSDSGDGESSDENARPAKRKRFAREKSESPSSAKKKSEASVSTSLRDTRVHSARRRLPTQQPQRPYFHPPTRPAPPRWASTPSASYPARGPPLLRGRPFARLPRQPRSALYQPRPMPRSAAPQFLPVRPRVHCGGRGAYIQFAQSRQLHLVTAEMAHAWILENGYLAEKHAEGMQWTWYRPGAPVSRPVMPMRTHRPPHRQGPRPVIGFPEAQVRPAWAPRSRRFEDHRSLPQTGLTTSGPRPSYAQPRDVRTDTRQRYTRAPVGRSSVRPSQPRPQSSKQIHKRYKPTKTRTKKLLIRNFRLSLGKAELRRIIMAELPAEQKKQNFELLRHSYDGDSTCWLACFTSVDGALSTKRKLHRSNQAGQQIFIDFVE